MFEHFIGAKTNDNIDIIVEMAEEKGLTVNLVTLDGFTNIDIDDDRLNVGQQDGLIVKIWRG